MTALAHDVRAARWVPVLVAGGFATVVVALGRNEPAATPVQVVSVLLAAAMGFALDDAAFDVFGASPRSLLRRRLQRIAVLGLPAIGAWALFVAVQRPAGREESIALVTLFAGMLSVSTAIGGVAARRSAGRTGGVAAAPGLLVALIASSALPPRWRPMPLGDIPGGWRAIYLHWTLTAIVGLAVLLWSSRDPAR